MKKIIQNIIKIKININWVMRVNGDLITSTQPNWWLMSLTTLGESHMKCKENQWIFIIPKQSILPFPQDSREKVVLGLGQIIDYVISIMDYGWVWLSFFIEKLIL